MGKEKFEPSYKLINDLIGTVLLGTSIGRNNFYQPGNVAISIILVSNVGIVILF